MTTLDATTIFMAFLRTLTKLELKDPPSFILPEEMGEL